ncbi:MAG: MATE family efflux transporter [Bacteroidales bacterium]|nr:MATE family efflux transporter [Bacteroidales bacterium]
MSLLNVISARVKGLLASGDSRTGLLKKNIIGSVLLKGMSIVVTLALVPLTIDYVNAEQYGIWLTLSSLMTWLTFFDIGLAMGLRNRFAEAKARGETERARQYISTAYAAIGVMALILVCLSIPLCRTIDWCALLKVSETYRSELTDVMMVLFGAFAATLVLAVMSNILIGDQLTAISSLVGVVGQVIVLAVIWILVHTQVHGTLLTLACVLAWIPPATLLVASIILFATRYRCYAPSHTMVRPSMVKDLLGIGGKFFIITVSMLFIFQLMNVIISRELGPLSVTEYNIAYRYFNTANMVAMLVLAPFWSASTDAYTLGNLEWLSGKLRSLERMVVLLLLPGIALMVVLSPVVYRLWIGTSVTVSWSTSIAIACYIMILTLSNTYMFLINGIGKVQLQLLIYLGFALIAYPVMTILCRWWGIPGLLALPALIYIVQAVAMRMQLHRILNSKAEGIWNK